MSSESLHVPRERLSDDARLLHYAITSLKEELDAIDWYRQRADDTEDEQLKQILLHNMREEMEHASMLIEWLRRRDATFAGFLKTYLFTEGPLADIEQAAEHGAGAGDRADAPASRADPDALTIGSLIGR
jgi:ferritin-like protein